MIKLGKIDKGFDNLFCRRCVTKGGTTMAVITISRKLGSQGDYVAEKAAEMLGYHYVDKKFIGAVLDKYGLIKFDKTYNSIPSFWDKFDAQKAERRETMVNMLNRVMRALACHGNVVILGRSGFLLFKGYADVLNIRIQAPVSYRIERVMKKEKTTLDEAETIVKHGDEVRSAFVKSFYNVQWDIFNAFDLLIDTSKISSEMAIQWVVEAARKLEESNVGEGLTTTSIQVDSVLAETISDALKCNTAHR